MSRGSNCALRTLFSSLLLLFIVVTTARAQDAATGAIRGTVLDPLGRLVPQATIVLVNIATASRHSATTGAHRHLAIHIPPPGHYSARALAQGMAPQVTTQLHLDLR